MISIIINLRRYMILRKYNIYSPLQLSLLIGIVLDHYNLYPYAFHILYPSHRWGLYDRCFSVDNGIYVHIKVHSTIREIGSRLLFLHPYFGLWKRELNAII